MQTDSEALPSAPTESVPRGTQWAPLRVCTETIKKRFVQERTPEIHKLLIVDDDPITIRVLIAIFENDHHIRVTTSGAQALALARNTQPDLILLDVMMPGMDGYEVCKILKQDPNTQEIPVIFITSLDDEQAETKGFDSGAVDYVTKPISAGVVRRRVFTHIALKKAQDRLTTLAITLEQKNRALTRLCEKDIEDNPSCHLSGDEDRIRNMIFQAAN